MGYLHTKIKRILEKAEKDQVEADRDRLQAELDKARAGEQNNADLAQHYFKELTQRTADRDRWKALAVDLLEAMEHEARKGEKSHLRQRRLEAWIRRIKNEQEAQDEN